MARSNIPSPGLLSLAAAAVLLAAGVPHSAQAQAPEIEDPNRGERLYVVQCSRCHGIEGSGGQGPVLARPVLPKGQSAAEVGRVIAFGLPDGGMPAHWTLSETEVGLIAEYVMTLGQIQVVELPGDPDRGQDLFFNEGRCSTCHIVSGRGNGFGPELTDIGARRAAENIRKSIVDPGAALPLGTGVLPGSGFASHLTVEVRDSTGSETRGVRLNEDGFTIQLMDRRGTVHSVEKSKAQVSKRFDLSLMPARDLTDEQIDDLVSYLANLRGVSWTSVSQW